MAVPPRLGLSPSFSCGERGSRSQGKVLCLGSGVCSCWACVSFGTHCSLSLGTEVHGACRDGTDTRQTGSLCSNRAGRDDRGQCQQRAELPCSMICSLNVIITRCCGSRIRLRLPRDVSILVSKVLLPITGGEQLASTHLVHTFSSRVSGQLRSVVDHLWRCP